MANDHLSVIHSWYQKVVVLQVLIIKLHKNEANIKAQGISNWLFDN